MAVRRAATIAIVLGLALAACSSTPTPIATPTAEPSPGFLPMDRLNIQIVRLSGAGESAGAWLAGVAFEADRIGLAPVTTDAGGDEASMVAGVRDAIEQALANSNPDAIILEGGDPDTLATVIGEALDAGVPILTSGFIAADERSSAVHVAQSEIGRLVLVRLRADLEAEGGLLHLTVPGDPVVAQREEAWSVVLGQNAGLVELARLPVDAAASVDAIAGQVVQSLTEHTDVAAIFAPTDLLATAASAAVQRLGLAASVRVYGGDVSTAAIATMIAEASPWVATAAADPYDLGAVTFRCAVIAAQGLDVDRELVIQPVLLTRERLISSGVASVADLHLVIPEMETTGTCSVAL